MKVLLLSSGGKAHAIIWKLKQSPAVEQVFCNFTNAEIKNIAEFVDIKDDKIEELVDFIKENEINLVIADSDLAINSGVSDRLRAENILVFGASTATAKLENNKSFAKKFFHKYKIPTPRFATFDKETQAIDYARKAEYPLTVKFDSRSKGMGTVVCECFNQAKNAIQFCLNNLYKPVLIEDFVAGKHVTFHVISDGYNALPLSPAYVYKKSEDGNSGVLTEGVGAYAPVSYVDLEMEEKIAHQIFFPLIDAMNSEKMASCGVIKANILVDENQTPLLLGVNVSFGDPETQTILPLLEEDLFAVLYSASIGALGDDFEFFNLSDEHSVCVVTTSTGYPSKIKKGQVIEGLDLIDQDETIVFHSCTTKNLYAETLVDGGKILSVVSKAATLNRASELTYDALETIDYEGKKYRKDIARKKIVEMI